MGNKGEGGAPFTVFPHKLWENDGVKATGH